MEIEFIDPKVELIPEIELKKKIELCGRVCYKSEDKITEGSADKFLKMIARNGHTSVYEHGTVYFNESRNHSNYDFLINHKLINSPYTFVAYTIGENIYTTNFRVIFNAIKEIEKSLLKSNDQGEASGEEILEKTLKWIDTYGVEPDKHIKRVSLRFIVDRGVSHELVRHRVMSVSQESTRYVNYGNKGFQFIKPAWWDNAEDDNLDIKKAAVTKLCEESASTYNSLLKLGQTPQQARAVLPNAIKTEVVLTATIPQWKEWLTLRNSPAAHPDMQVVAKKVESIINEIN